MEKALPTAPNIPGRSLSGSGRELSGSLATPLALSSHAKAWRSWLQPRRPSAPAGSIPGIDPP